MKQSKKLHSSMVRMITQQKESGQTIAEFCQASGIKQCKFFYWKKKLKDNGQLATEPKKTTGKSTNTFLPLTLPRFHDTASSEKIELRFPSGVLAYFPVRTEPSIIKTVIHECGKRC